MNHILLKLPNHSIIVYLYDVSMYSHTINKHPKVLPKVFILLQKYKLMPKSLSDIFFMETIDLGYIIDAKEEHIDQSKVDVVTKWPEPPNLNEVK